MHLSRYLILMATFCGLTAAPMFAFSQVSGTVFSNDYEYREDFFESKEGQLETIWRSRIYGEATALETQSAQIGGFDVFAESKYQLLEPLEARVFLRGKFEAGRSQSFFGDLEPGNAILIREAAIKYTPNEFLSAKAGVLNQDWLDMPLLVFRQSFPGASAEVSTHLTDELKLGAVSQYLIPTSQTLSSRTMDAEKSPTFLTQSLYLKWSDRSFGANLSANLFEYRDLPSLVAFESQKFGNTRTLISGPNNSRFLYAFKGWFTSAGFNYRMNSLLEPFAYINVVKNEEAPETFNDAQLIGVGTKFHTNNYVFSFFYENYFAESDVAPAFYNAWAYGNTNKKGNGFELGVQFKKKNFRVRAQYYGADVINPNGLQQNQEYFYLGVETGYDKI